MESDNIFPDEDEALDPNSDTAADIAEADENVIATIMAQQNKYLARTSRLGLTSEVDEDAREEAEDLILESKLGLPNASVSHETRSTTRTKTRISRPTNIPNETPPPFMSMRLIDPQGPRADLIVRDNWLSIVNLLPDREYCALVRTCRYFRQLLQQYRTDRVLARIDRSNLAQTVLRVIREDDVDLLQVMCIRGDVPDINVAMVHALHNRSIRCICLMQNTQHDISNAFIEILKLDNVDLFKIMRQNGAEITDQDIGQIIEYDALAIYSYLMHLIDPRMLLSVELDRSPESMTQMMLHAADHCSYRIMSYLRSLGVEFVPPPAPKIVPLPPPVPEPGNPGLPVDEAFMGEDIDDIPILRPGVSSNEKTHQYAAFGDITRLRAIAENETRIVGALKLYHTPGTNLPRLNETQLQNILLSTEFDTFKTLIELGYKDLETPEGQPPRSLVSLLTNVTRAYKVVSPQGVLLGEDQTAFTPIVDPERELYIVEVLKVPLSTDLVTACIVDMELFRRLHELGMRADSHKLIMGIINSEFVRHDLPPKEVAAETVARLRLAHQLGYQRADLPISRNYLHMLVVCELINSGYTLSDNARLTAHGWEHLPLETHELESLYQHGLHWRHDDIKRCLDEDHVGIIAATVNLGIWEARTNIMLWVIASRAQACFEYLVHKETLPYAAQAFRYLKTLDGVKRTNTLNDDFPIDWICLAYYMPWPWFVKWIRDHASPTLLDKIKANSREWSRTQGLDRLIPPGWHDIRNFIAKRLIVDGRPKITRDLIEGKDVSLIMFED